MELYRVSPATVRGLALVGGALVALGGFLPHHVCWHRPQCAVPWVSLAPLALAAVVLRRGWSPRVAGAYGLAVGVFWAAGLWLVVTNLTSIYADALIGTGLDRGFERFGAALYLYGGSLGLASTVVYTAQRAPPGRRRIAPIAAGLLAALPLAALAAALATTPHVTAQEGVPEVVTVLTASLVGVVLLALVREG